MGILNYSGLDTFFEEIIDAELSIVDFIISFQVFIEQHSPCLHKMLLDKQNHTNFDEALQTCFGK